MNSVKVTTPQIGFDRFIPLDWATCSLKVRSGAEIPDALEDLLTNAELGAPSKKKTRSVLKGLWLSPRVDLIDFADRGIGIRDVVPDVSIPALCWGMAIAAYPFFGKVAELIGRLTALQGDCAAAQIHRRMAETYGEREGTRRATNRVIQTQASWGAIERVDKGKRVIRHPSTTASNDALIAWLIEAALRYTGKALPVSALEATPVLYPFQLDQSLSFVASNSATLELRSDGPSSRVVALQ